MPQWVCSQWLQAGFDSAFTDSNSLNRRPLNWRQQTSAGRSHWSQTGSHSGFHCLQFSQLEATQLEAAALTGTLSLTATGSHSGLHYRGHLHILFHDTHLLPIRSLDLLLLIYTGASLIDSLVKSNTINTYKYMSILFHQYTALSINPNLDAIIYH